MANVVIFDKSADSDPTGVGVLIPSPEWSGTLDELAAKDLPPLTAYEIVDDSTLPWHIDRSAWEWV